MIAPTDLIPQATPKPTRKPSPAPTPLPDLAAYFPAEVDGHAIAVRQWTGATMPDDSDCLQVCRWQVSAYADQLGIRPEDVEVAIATVIGDEDGPIQVAALRVPHPTGMPFVIGYWHKALKTKWPDVFHSGELLNLDRQTDGFRLKPGDQDDRAPAWFVRSQGDVVVIVSDEIAQSFGYPPRTRVTKILQSLPAIE